LTAEKRQAMALAMALKIVPRAKIGEFHGKVLYGFRFVETDDITVWNMESIGGSDDQTTVVGLV
jgi:hypothetical protein